MCTVPDRREGRYRDGARHGPDGGPYGLKVFTCQDAGLQTISLAARSSLAVVRELKLAETDLPPEEFLKHAADCEKMARSTRDPRSRATWNRMAERWRQCAERFYTVGAVHSLVRKSRRYSTCAPRPWPENFDRAGMAERESPFWENNCAISAR